MICPRCGAQVRDGAPFCPKCGATMQGVANTGVPFSGNMTTGAPNTGIPNMQGGGNKNNIIGIALLPRL